MEDLLSSIDATGLANLFLELMNLLFKFDIKTIDTDTVAKLLDVVYPIWNPIWAAVNDWLGSTFGFDTSPLL